MLIHSPNGCKDPSWFRLKQVAHRPIWGVPHGIRAQVLELSLTVLLGELAGSWTENEAARTSTGVYMAINVTGKKLNLELYINI